MATRRVLCYAFFVLLYIIFVLIMVIRQSSYPSISSPSHSYDSSGQSSRQQWLKDPMDRLPSLSHKVIGKSPLPGYNNTANGLLILGSNTALSPIPAYSSAPTLRGNKSIILIWTGPEDIGQDNLGGCPDYGCVITRDYRLLNQSTAVIFTHGVDRMPKIRHSWQYYVFFTQESPTHIQPGQPFEHFFNLTLSYRRDSDAPSPYGYAVKRHKPRVTWKRNLTRIIQGKKKLVAWFVSHCGASSDRDAYVNELKKWIPVDVYGGCGTLTCSRNSIPSRREPSKQPWSYETDEEEEFLRDMDNCDRMLESDYKFYLAFENSICKDYATEKFWQKLPMAVVVIVLKRSIVEPYAPPGSFIAADDFTSARDLAMYLKHLDSNPSEYELRFSWRTNYRPVFLNGGDHDARERPWGFCTLCSIVRQRKLHKSYKDINAWWAKDVCDNDLVKRVIVAQKA